MQKESTYAEVLQEELSPEFSKADVLFKAWQKEHSSDGGSDLAQLLACEADLFKENDNRLDKATQASFTKYIHFLMTDFLLQQCAVLKEKESETDKDSIISIEEELQESRDFGQSRCKMKNRFVFGFLCTVGIVAELTDGALSALAVKAVVAPQFALPVGIALASVVAISGLISWVGFECQAVARNSGVCLFSLHREMVTTLLMMEALQKTCDVYKGSQIEDPATVSTLRTVSQLYCDRYLRRYDSVKPSEYPILKQIIKLVPTLAIGFSTVAFLLSVAGVITLPHISIALFAAGIAALLIYRIYEYCSIDSKAVGESFDRATNNPRAEFKQAAASAKHMITTIKSDICYEEKIQQQAEIIVARDNTINDKDKSLDEGQQKIEGLQGELEERNDKVAQLTGQLGEKDRMITQLRTQLGEAAERTTETMSGDGSRVDYESQSSVLLFAAPHLQQALNENLGPEVSPVIQGAVA